MHHRYLHEHLCICTYVSVCTCTHMQVCFLILTPTIFLVSQCYKRKFSLHLYVPRDEKIMLFVSLRLINFPPCFPFLKALSP